MFIIPICHKQGVLFHDTSYYIKVHHNCQAFFKEIKKQTSDQLVCFQM